MTSFGELEKTTVLKGVPGGLLAVMAEEGGELGTVHTLLIFRAKVYCEIGRELLVNHCNYMGRNHHHMLAKLAWVEAVVEGLGEYQLKPSVLERVDWESEVEHLEGYLMKPWSLVEAEWELEEDRLEARHCPEMVAGLWVAIQHQESVLRSYLQN